uniref:Uncharacterized protein n=1 Tax=Setaria digitata TaxID=48799 RepID=A0A915Q237_9BILA
MSGAHTKYENYIEPGFTLLEEAVTVQEGRERDPPFRYSLLPVHYVTTCTLRQLKTSTTLRSIHIRATKMRTKVTTAKILKMKPETISETHFTCSMVMNEYQIGIVQSAFAYLSYVRLIIRLEKSTKEVYMNPTEMLDLALEHLGKGAVDRV